MKHIIATAIVAIIFFSCQHDPMEPVEPPLPVVLKPNDYPPGLRKHGWASAIKNDTIDWQASAEASFQLFNRELYFCNFTTHSSNTEGWDFLREQVNFAQLPLAKGTYSINNDDDWNENDGIAWGGAARYLGEGDEVRMGYFVDESYGDENYIKITVIDTIAKVVEGEFSVHFVADPFFQANLWLYPEYTSFKSGKFRCQLVPW